MESKKIICVYQVIMPYRVGVFERLSKLGDYDFELLYGKSDKRSKKKNYVGVVDFKARQQCSFYLPIKTNNGESTLQIMPFLFFKLVAKRPDVILCEGASSLFNASVAFLYAKLFGKKYIWLSLGELKGRAHNGIRQKIDKWIHYIERHSDAIFTYSSFGASHFIERRGIDKEKVFISVNVFDTDKKLEYIKILQVKKTDAFHIVFVGAIIKVKRLEVLVDAFQELSVTHTNIYLDIIGDGSYFSTIKQYISKQNNNHIIIHGRKTGEELSHLLLQSDVLVLPGLGGLAICDGMIHSLPVICGSADGTELDLIDESCGFVTENVTKTFLVDKLSLLINDRNLAHKMGRAAFDRITQKYSISNYMAHLQECINYVIKKK